jgi:restriction system protein
MARRRGGKDAHPLIVLFGLLPWWAGPPVALAVYLGSKLTGALLASSESALTRMFAPAFTHLAGLFALFVLVLWIMSLGVRLAGSRSQAQPPRSAKPGGVVPRGAFGNLLAAVVGAGNERQTDAASELRLPDWQRLELAMGEAFHRKGYQVEQRGGGKPDGGIDLVAREGGETVLVQCKHWNAWKVGVRQVREMYGVLMAEGATSAIIATTGKFTREASDFAAGKPIELWDGKAVDEFLGESVESAVSAVGSPPAAAQPSGRSASPPGTPPACPRCGAPMVARVARRGPQSGREFYGCTRYPSCRGIVNITP